MGGKEMADVLRTSHPDTKVLFTSGYTEDAMGHHGVLRPGIVFLQKPYQTATLARKVREVLDEGLIQSR
jgi:FixJ family two-component response regulator